MVFDCIDMATKVRTEVLSYMKEMRNNFYSMCDLHYLLKNKRVEMT